MIHSTAQIGLTIRLFTRVKLTVNFTYAFLNLEFLLRPISCTSAPFQPEKRCLKKFSVCAFVELACVSIGHSNKCIDLL